MYVDVPAQPRVESVGLDTGLGEKEGQGAMTGVPPPVIHGGGEGVRPA